MRFALLPLVAVFSITPLLAAACSGSDASKNGAGSGDGPDGSTSSSSSSGNPGSPTDEGGTVPTNCPRLAPTTDHTRKVVISHPFGNDSSKAKLYEVLELTAAGDLTKKNETFEMGVGFSEIVFTPDGQVGLIAQDDGTIGVFTFDPSGNVKVVHAGFKGPFSANRIVVSRDGSRAWVLDEDTKENGGGVHEVSIGCDGTLTYVGLAIPGGKAHAMALMPNDPDRAVLIAGAAFDSAPTDYAHRLDVSGSKPTRIASGGVFADQDAIASWVAITNDGKWALVTDNGFLKGSRMAPVALDTMKAGATITVANPAAVVMSPYGNSALLLDSDGEDALRVVSYDPSNATTPFTVGAEVAYKDGKKTALPTLAFVIGQGSLKGHVLVAENVGVRQLVFDASGSITDIGSLTFDGDALTNVVGSLGLQP